MKEIYRRYNCLNCNCQIILCSHCDKGNRYCKQCAPMMALKAQRTANKRYQSTYRGRLNHAARQKRYRERNSERQKHKVTYPGSKLISLCDLLSKKRKGVVIKFKPDKKENIKAIFCHCCGKSCSGFLRHDYLSDVNQNKEHRVAYKEKINHFLRNK